MASRSSRLLARPSVNLEFGSSFYGDLHNFVYVFLPVSDARYVVHRVISCLLVSSLSHIKGC